jgi:methylisocitrate lyase
LFIEAPTDIEQMHRICSELDGLTLANNVEGGKTPFLSAPELQAIGYAAVAYPVSATYTIARAVRELMVSLARTGTTGEMVERMVRFEEFNKIVGIDEIRTQENACANFATSILHSKR